MNQPNTNQAQPAPDAPTLALRQLDTLWLQVAGTLCNLACRHCFISCGPKNTNHALMTLAQVEVAIDAAVVAGVREFYFTGGEPFIHPQIVDLIEVALKHGPLTILTNGLLFDQITVDRLAELFGSAPYSLDVRISLDGTTAAQNDPLRGPGTFDRILQGISMLASAGIDPVLTVTEVDEHAGDDTHARFVELLRGLGVRRPRVKILRPFRIGREARRGRPYERWERVTADDLVDGAEHLQCGTCRMVTARGWWPCPILVEDPEARMGDSLADALAPAQLRSAACYTCHVEGVSCRT